MNWKTFCEINRSLFTWPKDFGPTTFYKIAGALASLAGLASWYLKAPDGVVHWLIANLITFPSLKSADAIQNWDSGSHVVLHAASTFVLLGVVYAISFAAVAQDRLDYRHQHALALGLKFTSVRREQDITNLAGDCRTMSVEEFEVYGIELSYLERHFQLTSGDQWPCQPTISVENSPENSNCNPSVKDDGPRRVYQLNFVGPLHQTAKPVKLEIKDNVPKAFWMYEDETPDHPVLGGPVEATSWFVVEPIDKLEISVTFPYDYRVSGESQMSVRYKDTRTVHREEEARLRSENALKSSKNGQRLTLTLTVEEPILGLQYYVYWEPPKRPKSG